MVKSVLLFLLLFGFAFPAQAQIEASDLAQVGIHTPDHEKPKPYAQLSLSEGKRYLTVFKSRPHILRDQSLGDCEISVRNVKYVKGTPQSALLQVTEGANQSRTFVIGDTDLPLPQLGSTITDVHLSQQGGFHTIARLSYLQIAGQEPVLVGLLVKKRRLTGQDNEPWEEISCHAPWHENWIPLDNLAPSLSHQGLGDCEFDLEVNEREGAVVMNGELRQAHQEPVHFRLAHQPTNSISAHQSVTCEGQFCYIFNRFEESDNQTLYRMRMQVSTEEDQLRYIHVMRFDRKEKRGGIHKFFQGHGPWKENSTWIRFCEVN